MTRFCTSLLTSAMSSTTATIRHIGGISRSTANWLYSAIRMQCASANILYRLSISSTSHFICASACMSSVATLSNNICGTPSKSLYIAARVSTIIRRTSSGEFVATMLANKLCTYRSLPQLAMPLTAICTTSFSLGQTSDPFPSRPIAMSGCPFACSFATVKAGSISANVYSVLSG